MNNWPVFESPAKLENLKPPQPELKSAVDVSGILDERAKRYGKFISHATISQRLKDVITANLAHHGKSLTDDQKEALAMICHKIARIVNGDPDYADSWADIAGYAQLVADRLNGVSR